MNLTERVLGKMAGYQQSILCRYFIHTHIVGYPKAGNTWVRFFLANYIAGITNSEVDLEFDRSLTHQLHGARVYSSHLGSLRGHQARLISELNFEVLLRCSISEMKGKRIAFLSRDPRDVVISLYFHSRKYRSDETISDFLRDERVGIRQVIKYMNHWYDVKSSFSSFRIFRYEDRRNRPFGEFVKLLNFLQWPIDNQKINEFVKLSDFDNMQIIEKTRSIDHKTFRYGDVTKPESLRMRKGKVGGYLESVSDSDVCFMNKEMKLLNSAFGY